MFYTILCRFCLTFNNFVAYNSFKNPEAMIAGVRKEVSKIKQQLFLRICLKGPQKPKARFLTIFVQSPKRFVEQNFYGLEREHNRVPETQFGKDSAIKSSNPTTKVFNNIVQILDTFRGFLVIRNSIGSELKQEATDSSSKIYRTHLFSKTPKNNVKTFFFDTTLNTLQKTNIWENSVLNSPTHTSET